MKRTISRIIAVLSVASGIAYSQALSNLEVSDVDIVADLATQKQVGTTVPTFVAAIQSDLTLTADKTYILKDALFVTDGAKLTIEAGTRIYGVSYENGAGTADNQLGSIVVTRGSQIDVLGTANNPVLMTTIDVLEADRGEDIDNDGSVADPPTQDTAGRWGGLVVLGNAFVLNMSDPDGTPGNGDDVNLHEKSIEGFAAINFDDLDNDGFTDLVEYGNDANGNGATLAANNAESSGTIQYLSIRHGGFALADGNEINGLTLGGVGSGTTIDHVEVVTNADDGVEFFGGTVNTRHLVVSFTEDDSFDIDQGHSGTHQFWFAITNSTAGDHGGEWDGVDGDVKANGLGNSSPVILNATFLDAGSSSSTEALKFDDRFDGFIANNAFGDYGTTFDNAGDGIGANLALEGNVFAGANDGGGDTTGFNTGNTFSQALGLVGVSATPNGGLDPRPMAGSYLLDANNASDFDESVIPGAQVVDYAGAFSTTDLWIDGWTYLSEAGFLPSSFFVNKEANDVDVVADIATQKQVGSTPGAEAFVAAITTDTTFTADKTYLLGDAVFVTDGAKLTIEAGTKIYGASYENGAGTADNVLGSIVVTRGSQIDVLGTAANPVLMTTIDALEAQRGNDIDGDGITAAAPTQDTTGRWGGLVVLGNAFVLNMSDPDGTPGNGDDVNLFEKSIEGFAAVNFDDLDNDGFTDIIEYGNDANAAGATTLEDNNAESSGTIQYLSIRHGGFALSDGNEINGLTLGGVGSGTTIDHVEVVSNADDGVEFFGGTVNTSHLVVSFTEDDSFDIDQGHNGTHQFWFAITNSTAGDHGGEWDGVDGDVKADGLGNSAPVILNATFLDAGSSSSTEGVKFDDRFDGFIANNAWSDYGVTFDNAGDGIGANLALEGNVFGGANDGGADTSGFNTGNTFNQDLGLTSVSDQPNGQLDPRPTAGSFLLDSVNTKDFDESLINADPTRTVQVVDYSGAFGQTDLWIDGWTFLAEAGYLPDVAGEIEIVGIGVVSGTVSIEFATEVGKTYKVTQSPDLQAAFTDVVGQTGIAGTGATVIANFAAPGSDYFFRIEEE